MGCVGEFQKCIIIKRIFTQRWKLLLSCGDMLGGLQSAR